MGFKAGVGAFDLTSDLSEVKLSVKLSSSTKVASSRIEVLPFEMVDIEESLDLSSGFFQTEEELKRRPLNTDDIYN
ncbi:hypothetical protein ST47_g9522 [Ascochyta rabiei]|uniref:Uncharacterized protein n=1 Tax=Didymella rabiei TaxID=5454 RepID=A0A162X1B7_DIDRA|nr:hypothetical protein ST47_g9522 [Ascochyta rabiei]